MSVKLNNNPTCVLTDADIYSESQKAKMAKNLMSGLPASTGEGDKVLVLDENGDPQLKDYSAGGGGGTSYTAGNGIGIFDNEIYARTDGYTIATNMNGELEVIGGRSGGYTEISYTPGSSDSGETFAAVDTAYQNHLIPVLSWTYRSAGNSMTNKLVLANYQYTGTSDMTTRIYDYWFVGSIFTNVNIGEGTGTFKRCLVKVSDIYNRSEGTHSYSISPYLISSSNMPFDADWSEF